MTLLLILAAAAFFFFLNELSQLLIVKRNIK
jgi:hypothetical protein